MIIKQKWKILNRVTGLLVSLESGEEIPRSGDFIEDENRAILILSSKIQGKNFLKLEVLAEDIKNERINLIRNRPQSGKIFIEGRLHPWTIASLRYLGFDVIDNPSEAEFIISSQPPSKNYEDAKIIIAPTINASGQSISLINNFLKERLIRIKFLLGKPLKPERKNAFSPLIGATIKLPENVVMYPLITGEIPICYIDSEIIAAYSPESNLLVLSSEALLIIYDEILGGGDNKEFIKWLFRFKIEPKEIEERTIERDFSLSEIVISYSDLDAVDVFNHLLYKVSLYGGIIRRKMLQSLEAEVDLMLGSFEQTKVFIKVKGGYVILKPEKEDAILYGILRSIAMDAIRELHERRRRKERIKRIFEIAFDLQLSLLTLKDAIEAELGHDIIEEQVNKIIRIAISDENFRKLAEEIKQSLNQGKITLLDVNNWLEELRKLSLSLIE